MTKNNLTGMKNGTGIVWRGNPHVILSTSKVSETFYVTVLNVFDTIMAILSN